MKRIYTLLGPPGEGKTRELLWLFECLCRIPRATVVLMNPKGGLARMARDYVLSHGLTKRLVWFDPGDPDTAISYNPLWPNGLAVAAHAKAVRESIRSAWGQANLDQTPQLARLLYLSLGVCRALELTIADAVQLLRSGAARRAAPAQTPSAPGRRSHVITSSTKPLPGLIRSPNGGKMNLALRPSHGSKLSSLIPSSHQCSPPPTFT